MSTQPSHDTLTLGRDAYDRIRQLVYEEIGIELGPSKQSLVEARLNKRLRALGLAHYDDYLALVEGQGDGEELVQLLDAISTNVTSFFREPAGLQAIVEAHTVAVAKGQRRLRYWSAACSSGEEPYSLAMLLAEATPLTGLDLAILGTDISTRVLQRARRGRYGQQAVATVPEALRKRHLRRDGDLWEVDPALRGLVTCNRLNLIKPPFPMKGPFDGVLCRNVMIYFDRETRHRLVDEIHRLLKPGGLLVTGQAESLAGLHSGYRPVGPYVHQRM